MKPNEDPLRDLSEIRSMMERSSRFISLSGLSGIFAGTFALIGAALAANYLNLDWDLSAHFAVRRNPDQLQFLILDGLAVLVLSLTTGVYFTTRSARRKGLRVWDATSQRLLINLAIPLVSGGLFCLLLIHHAPQLVASATLLFYGLALLNGSKYTLHDVRYLGVSEIALGLIGGYFASSMVSLLIWALGFGVLHIVYGSVMYRKYEV
ncbi:MAG: hypothetical protein LH606_03325 [Cytophagaceae bacterium]|nr:hypothetical protein [Cytophagaceae bacterium]